MQGMHAFTPASTQINIVHRYKNLSTNTLTLIHATSDAEEDVYSMDDENDALLNELRDKKKETFGKDIPINEEFEEAAKNSENSFLAAMLEQSQSFKELKSEKGAEAAVSEFRRRIQEEDESQRIKYEQAASEEAIVQEKIVQQIEEEMEDIEEEREDGNSWQ